MTHKLYKPTSRFMTAAKKAIHDDLDKPFQHIVARLESGPNAGRPVGFESLHAQAPTPIDQSMEEGTAEALAPTEADVRAALTPAVSEAARLAGEYLAAVFRNRDKRSADFGNKVDGWYEGIYYSNGAGGFLPRESAHDDDPPYYSD